MKQPYPGDHCLCSIEQGRQHYCYEWDCPIHGDEWRKRNAPEKNQCKKPIETTE